MPVPPVPPSYPSNTTPHSFGPLRRLGLLNVMLSCCFFITFPHSWLSSGHVEWLSFLGRSVSNLRLGKVSLLWDLSLHFPCSLSLLLAFHDENLCPYLLTRLGAPWGVSLFCLRIQPLLSVEAWCRVEQSRSCLQQESVGHLLYYARSYTNLLVPQVVLSGLAHSEDIESELDG